MLFSIKRADFSVYRASIPISVTAVWRWKTKAMSARAAIEVLAYQVKKYIGSYAAAMGGLDAIVFTAGIGENDRLVREMVCKDMSYLGIEIDEDYNKTSPKGTDVELTKHGAKVRTFVIPTNEEYMIALDTYDLIK